MMNPVPDFSGTRVLVAGDVMLDRYWSGSTDRVSPEAPVPVVRIAGAQDRAGGAGNVALNLAALGVTTSLAGICGADGEGRALGAALEAAGIDARLRMIEGLATITKLRVLSRHQQLIRLDFEAPDAHYDCRELEGAYRDALRGADVVVLSDYAKGSLSDAPALIKAARQAGKPVLVDPKGRDFRRYAGASLLTPNRGEFEAVVGPCRDETEFRERAEALRRELKLDALLVTRSEQGMTLFAGDHEVVHLPTHAREVFDVTGAGDTVIATLAAALAAGQSFADAAALANVAAGVVVGKLGAATVTPAELHFALHGEVDGVLDEVALAAAMTVARERGERVVMTNGCFDILHAGHVAYLRAARALGDRLVVAVNDDDSVRRLKGEGRPVNGLADRMAVLSGLGAVDWVVPFSEDTPERLICSLLPDLLVKGGDYRPEDVAGADCVIRNGGEVRILEYIDGRSTSGVIERIRGR